ncbi:MAG: phosphoribosyl-ATP diphosphatase [Methanobacteriaceae archaeon]|jgi:phosphoribosyl-ATP pyrophosphohydrolase|nr:phosphoribosyl-ATP diphosphatase [Candidatus Methanorudis spinitermitis]
MVDEKILKTIFNTLKDRKNNPIDSYTSKIMQNNGKKAEDKILEKIGEEATEVLIASKNNENLVHETTDLIFHAFLLLVYKGYELDDLLNEFEKRTH